MRKRPASLLLIVPLLLVIAFVMPTQAQSPCPGAPTTRLQVGGYARVLDPNGMTRYSGNPYANRYLNLSANASHQYYGIALSVDDPTYGYDFSGDPFVFVTEGPVCTDGVNLWRVQSGDGFTNIWVPETLGGSYLVEPVAGQASGAPAYAPARVVLTDVAPDLVVDGLAQLAFFGLGGGGEGLPPYDGDTTVGDLLDYVLSVYPPGTLVKVALRSPDNDVLAEKLAYAWHETESPVSYVLVDLPAYPGLATGVWTVELEAEGELRRLAYRLSQPQTPVMTSACERTKPVIYVSGLLPDETIVLAQIETDSNNVDSEGRQIFEIINRWRLQADDQGTLVIEDFTPYLRPSPAGGEIQRYWGVESAGGSWLDTQSFESTFLRITDTWGCYTSQIGVLPSAYWYTNDPLPPRLTPGDRARVAPGDPNNVRDQPSTAGSRIGQIPGGAEFLVLDGPAFSDDLRWWLVMYDDLIGWTVEGQGSDYWLEPLSSP